MATSAEVYGNDKRENNKAWYDRENQMVYDVRGTTPGCMPGNPAGVQGQTYCNSNSASGRCTVTLCQRAVTGEVLALSDLPNKDLASNNAGSAKIDYLALLSTTVLHEVRH